MSAELPKHRNGQFVDHILGIFSPNSATQNHGLRKKFRFSSRKLGRILPPVITLILCFAESGLVFFSSGILCPLLMHSIANIEFAGTKAAVAH